MTKKSTATGIPLTLRPSFQEYDFDQLDPVQHAELIIERTLAYGNRQELRWLFAYYGRPRLVKWVRQFGGHRLPRRRYNLWCVLLNLSPALPLRSNGTAIWPH
jgi:hypothetical protein